MWCAPNVIRDKNYGDKDKPTSETCGRRYDVFLGGWTIPRGQGGTGRKYINAVLAALRYYYRRPLWLTWDCSCGAPSGTAGASISTVSSRSRTSARRSPCSGRRPRPGVRPWPLSGNDDGQPWGKTMWTPSGTTLVRVPCRTCIYRARRTGRLHQSHVNGFIIQVLLPDRSR